MNPNRLKYLFVLVFLSSLTSASLTWYFRTFRFFLKLGGPYILAIALAFHNIPIIPSGPKHDQNLWMSQGEYLKYSSSASMNANAYYNKSLTPTPDLNIKTFKNGRFTEKTLGLRSSNNSIESNKDNSNRSNIASPTKHVEFNTLTRNIAKMPSKKIDDSGFSSEELDYLKLSQNMNSNILISFFIHKFSLEAGRSFAVSFFYLGGTLGSIFTRFDPKYTTEKYLNVSCILLFFGAILSYISSNWIILAIGRFLLGMASGIAGIMVPIFYGDLLMVEHSESEYLSLAAFFGMIYPLMAPGEILFGALIKQYLLDNDYLTWRGFNFVTGVLAIIAFILLNFNSSEKDPAVKNQKAPDAKSCIQKMPKQTMDNFLRTYFQEESKFFTIFLCLNIFQQFSFINGYFSYAKEIFGHQPNIYILLGVANFVGTLFNFAIKNLKDPNDTSDHYLAHIANTWAMKYIGLISGTGCTFFSFLMFIGFSKNLEVLKFPPALAFVVFFAFGVESIPLMINPEITAQDFHQNYCLFRSIVNWSCGFLITYTANMIFSTLKEGSLLFFGVFSLGFTLIMALSVPELDKKSDHFSY